MVTKDDDFVEHLYVATAHSYILVFTESGRVHWLKVHEIPEAGPAARGKAIVNLLNLEPSERLATTVAVREFPRRPLSRLRHGERHGEEDRRSRPTPTRGWAASSASTSTKATACSPCARPTAARTSCSPPPRASPSASPRATCGRWAAPPTASRGSSCARATGWSPWRSSIRTARCSRSPSAATASGRRSRTTACQGRGGLGIINLKVTPKTGEVVGVKYVTPEEGLMLITQEGMIIRLNVSGVREVGRSAQGVKLMNLDPEDRIVAVAKLAEKDEETEIELAKGDGGPVPAELELEAAESRADDGRPRRSSTTAGFEDGRRRGGRGRRSGRDGALRTVPPFRC